MLEFWLKYDVTKIINKYDINNIIISKYPWNINSKFYKIDELGDYLEEVMNFQPNKTNFRISLFCYNLTAADANDDATHDESNATYTELESYSVQRRGEVVKYNDVELTTYRCLKYLNFVRNDTYVTDK